MRKIDRHFNLQNLFSAVDILLSDPWLDPTEGLWILDIVSGAAGRYQAQEICEFFGLKYEEEYAWDEIDSFASGLSDELNDEAEKRGYKGCFNFECHEGDQSYGLVYYEDLEE